VTDVPPRLPVVRADLDRLGQVMHNLLSNATRYSAVGTEIRVRAHELDAERIEIQVIDQGAGIAAEDCARVFEKF
jgi:signal transduction histidine kinase